MKFLKTEGKISNRKIDQVLENYIIHTHTHIYKEIYFI